MTMTGVNVVQLSVRQISFSMASAMFISFSLVGCGSGDGYSGPTGTVSGVVKLDGSPLTETANVTFLSKEGFSATGQTDASGNFTLSSRGNSNIPVGKYNVAVAPAASGPAGDDPSQFMDAEGNTIDPEKVKSTIPASAHNPGSSGVTKDIAEGDQTVEIELKSK